MSIRLPLAAVRAYDAMRDRPGASPRRSGARDPALVAAVERRLRELISDGRLGAQDGYAGQMYVFWTEVDAHLRSGAFDDLLDGL
jgi:hypothetical protein